MGGQNKKSDPKKGSTDIIPSPLFNHKISPPGQKRPLHLCVNTAILNPMQSTEAADKHMVIFG